jgi:hypothetical protein
MCVQCTVEGCHATFKGEYGKGNLARHRRLKHMANNRIYSYVCRLKVAVDT